MTKNRFFRTEEAQKKLLKVFLIMPFSFLLIISSSVEVFAKKMPSEDRMDFKTKTIRGKITDETGQPLKGASIYPKGKSSLGTVSNDIGEFQIDVPDNSTTLVFSYVGMEPQEINVSGLTTVSVTMKLLAVKQQDEIIVVGYGTQKKTSLTASVSSVKGADIAKQPVADLTNSLGGRVTGVLFTQPSGQAGNDAAQIMIRGNSGALLIVDGVPRNFSQLNPADVESITILKDGAAVAPYGLGGANGVVLVTTKKGKLGKPVLTYDGYIGFQNPTVITEFVNAYDFARMKNEGAKNQGATIMPFSDRDLQLYKDGTDPDGHGNKKAFEDVFKKNTMQTSHNLTLTGGSEVVKYAMGLGYLNQEGMLPGIKYQRYNLSGNMQVQATNGTVVGLSLNGRVEDRDLTPAGYNQHLLFEGLSQQTAITTPYVYSNGLYSQTYALFYDNPSYKKITGNTLLSQFSIEQKLPVKGLSIKFVGSYDLNPYDPFSENNGIAGYTKTWNAPYSWYNIDTSKHPYEYNKATSAGLPSYATEFHQTQAFTYQGYINYTGNFNKSAVTGLLVLESRNTKSERFSTGRRNYNLPIPQIFAGGSAATDQFNDGNSSATKQRSLVYRATYSYDNKYLFEAAGRYDGHYYFAPNHRFGFFPAFSAAWRLSQEGFLKNISWINELKLKGSWGKSGALAGAPFQYQSGYNLYGNSVILGGVQTQGLSEASEPNPFITWEKVGKTNIGFEATILKNQFTIEANYFHESRKDMLVAPNVTVPLEYGVGLSQVNAGEMINRGFEFSLDAKHDFSKDLRVSFNFNFSYARNKMVQIFEDPVTYDVSNLRRTGRPAGVQFGYQAMGLFQLSDFDASGNLKPGIATQNFSPIAPGEIRYADINGPQGKPDGIIDYRDQVQMGDPKYPAIVYGFSPSIRYKNFELLLLFQGAAKRSTQLTQDAVLAFQNNYNAPITTLDYWTPSNPNASHPRILPTPSANTQQASTFWHRDVSYLRLRTGLLSYTLPTRVSKALRATFVKFYVSGQNLITWTKLKNFDPEISSYLGNSDRAWYFPTQKAITFGLNIQF